MNGYKVNIVPTLLSSKYSSNVFGEWEEAWAQDINPVVYKTDNTPDITSTEDISTNESAFIVWVVWSNGDSFGWAQNKNAEAIGIFKYRYCAEQLQGYIQDQNNSNAEEFLLETADGQIFY